ncbi:hypothetical protein F4780DRAFT_789387 [Xylariomycetidae sp. FL0641]|nr:hypothetical protein F4780DRAFT_789387 [Xylariomycetidae sp. FL0641]
MDAQDAITVGSASSSGSSRFPYPVQVGFWTNWSQGRVFGATLTLELSDATLLIAFVAFFITIVAGRIWQITCFTLHAVYSTPEPRDVLHHQRQAIIRNSAGTASSAYALLMLAWQWRSSRRSYLRVLPVLCCVVLLGVALTLTSGFSSRIAIGSEVLLTGSNCGALMPPAAGSSWVTFKTVYGPWEADLMSASANYATQCYSNTSAASGCGLYVQSKISSTADLNAPCPFGDLCQSADGNIALDSGLLDSHKDLGINAPENERFQFRRTLQCAPLKTEGYTSQFNLSADRSYTRYWYGPKSFIGNFTDEASNDRVYELAAVNISLSDVADYSMGMAVAAYHNDTLDVQSDFEPIAPLRKPDAEVSILFLSANGVLFMNETRDPWYRATTHIGSITDGSVGEDKKPGIVPVYVQDQPGAPLACSIQQEFCLDPAPPGEGRRRHCLTSPDLNLALGTPTGGGDAFADADADADARARVDWLATVAGPTTPRNAWLDLGVRALAARRSLSRGVQGPLARAQWQTDVRYWFDVSLAALQQAAVGMAAGPPAGTAEAAVRRPEAEAARKICRSQKVLSSDYVSFSVFGLATIFGLGVVLIAASALLEPLAARLRRRTPAAAYARLEWVTNGTLQLQRLAYEEAGFGVWAGGDAAFPVPKSTSSSAPLKLPPLDLSDRKHPRLPRKASGEAEEEEKKKSDEKRANQEEEKEVESGADDEAPSRTESTASFHFTKENEVEEHSATTTPWALADRVDSAVAMESPTRLADRDRKGRP